jgi:hypothetical protein
MLNFLQPYLDPAYQKLINRSSFVSYQQSLVDIRNVCWAVQIIRLLIMQRPVSKEIR